MLSGLIRLPETRGWQAQTSLRVRAFFASGTATPARTISQSASALAAGSAPFYLCRACGDRAS